MSKKWGVRYYSNGEEELETSSSLYRPLSARPCIRTCPFMSLTKQTFPQNSTIIGLSNVSLEMLTRFLVIEGTSNMSLSAVLVCVDKRLEAPYDRKVCPTSVIDKPWLLPMIS